ncbi:MAG: hypothetical protein U0798_13300 [Gemmataceae bacterium]
MRYLLTALLASALSAATFADDLKPVEVAGLKAKPPKEWKEKPAPTTAMGRLATIGVPAAEGSEDAEIVVFYFQGGGGTVAQNLDRQRGLFLPAEGKDKVDEKLTDTKVGTLKATCLDLSGTFKKKPSPMSDKFTAMKDYREIYVVVEKEEGTYYIRLLGPAKTVEKNKKSFDEWLASFK